MKKTISINIKGLNFLIEEDAYELLKDYLVRVGNALSHEEGGKEILEDVELRIAELCSEKLSDKKQVIEISDIEEVLTKMGDPSVYVDEDVESDSRKKQSANETYTSTDKKLFRDPDNCKIAGVCSGLGIYLGIDASIIRALFVILFFLGFGFILYILLIIIIPKANSSVDRLRMKGQPITVESIKDEFVSFGEKISDESKSFVKKLKNQDHLIERINTLGRLIAVAIGIAFILFGFGILTMFSIFIVSDLQFVPAEIEGGFLSLQETSMLIFEDAQNFTYAQVGVYLAACSVILFLLITGFKLIFNLKNRWAKMVQTTLVILAFVGGCFIGYVGISTAKEFAVDGELEKEVMTYSGDQLNFLPILKGHKKIDGFTVKSEGKFGILGIREGKIISTGINFEYRESKDSLFHVYHFLSAQGSSHRKALDRAKHINHLIEIEGDECRFDINYYYPKKDLIRCQEVTLIIEIPKGKKVSIDKHEIELRNMYDSHRKHWDDDGYDSDDFYEYEEGHYSRNRRYRHWS
jgi:phage shock protein PspC (stress-responsive transcriptional regulator)